MNFRNHPAVVVVDGESTVSSGPGTTSGTSARSLMAPWRDLTLDAGGGTAAGKPARDWVPGGTALPPLADPPQLRPARGALRPDDRRRMAGYWKPAPFFASEWISAARAGLDPPQQLFRQSGWWRLPQRCCGVVFLLESLRLWTHARCSTRQPLRMEAVHARRISVSRYQARPQCVAGWTITAANNQPGQPFVSAGLRGDGWWPK